MFRFTFLLRQGPRAFSSPFQTEGSRAEKQNGVVVPGRKGRLKNDVPGHDDFRNHFSKCLLLPEGGVGWVVGGVDTDERGVGKDGWSTPVAKGGKMAAHGKSMEASHCRRPRFHNPQTHPLVPPTHRQPPCLSLCNPLIFVLHASARTLNAMSLTV